MDQTMRDHISSQADVAQELSSREGVDTPVFRAANAVLWRERQTQLGSPIGLWLFIPFLVVSLAFAFDQPFVGFRPLNYLLAIAAIAGGVWVLRLRYFELVIGTDAVSVRMRGLRWLIQRDEIHSVGTVKRMPGLAAVLHRMGLGGSNGGANGMSWAGFRHRSIARIETETGTYLIGSKNPDLEEHLRAMLQASAAGP